MSDENILDKLNVKFISTWKEEKKISRLNRLQGRGGGVGGQRRQMSKYYLWSLMT